MRGAWIEITRKISIGRISPCRSPCGERGLKFQQISALTGIVQSLPVRGAWIEIQPHLTVVLYTRVAPRAGSVD